MPHRYFNDRPRKMFIGTLPVTKALIVVCCFLIILTVDFNSSERKRETSIYAKLYRLAVIIKSIAEMKDDSSTIRTLSWSLLKISSDM